MDKIIKPRDRFAESEIILRDKNMVSTTTLISNYGARSFSIVDKNNDYAGWFQVSTETTDNKLKADMAIRRFSGNVGGHNSVTNRLELNVDGEGNCGVFIPDIAKKAWRTAIEPNFIRDTNNNYKLGISYNRAVQYAADYFAVWSTDRDITGGGDNTNYERIIGTMATEQVHKVLSAARPMIKYKDVTIRDIQVNANGYVGFPNGSKPQAPSSDYTLFFVGVLTWGRWSPDGDDRWIITSNGDYIIGPPSKTASYLTTRWYYILSDNFVSY